MLVVFFLILNLVFVESLDQQASLLPSGKGNHSSIASTTSTTTQRPPNSTISVKVENPAKSTVQEPWYGKEATVEDEAGCKWPDDFDYRFNFCANRSSITLDGPEFGILDKEITNRFIEACHGGPGDECSDTKINRTDLIQRADLWAKQVKNITEFGACLKKNSEGMVKLCSGSVPVIQSVSGIAGLHLGVVDIVSKTFDHLKQGHNHSEQCLVKLSEALHFTGAFYLASHSYNENVVQCWEVKQGPCDEKCKQFANELACLKPVCPFLEPDLANFQIWQWYFTRKDACGITVDTDQCQSKSTSPVTSTTAPTLGSALVSKSKAVLEGVKEKYHQLEHSVESYTHLKFFQVVLIVGGTLAIFIGTTTILCMWYHGLICQHRSRGPRRTLRYAKLIPEDLAGRTTEERKSLTTSADFDDIE